MTDPIPPYACQAEAALSLYEDALWLKADGQHIDRITCLLYARAGRAALLALAIHHRIAVIPSTVNLAGLAASLETHEPVLRKPKRQAACRDLSRVLVLDGSDAGADYVTRDLFGEEDAEHCADAATQLLNLCCQRLLGMVLDDALLRLFRLRQRPMRDVELWRRRYSRVSRSKATGRSRHYRNTETDHTGHG